MSSRGKVSGHKAAAPRLARRRSAVGPARPTYLESGDNDRLFMMITALTAEVSVLRDRVDTHERLAQKRAAATRKAVEAYRPAPDVSAAREKARQELLSRVYRVLLEDLEGADQDVAAACKVLSEETSAA
jgi:hypothetical protein